MKNYTHPKPHLPLYYLYCMNFDCKDSVYNLQIEVAIPLTVKNLVAHRRCKCCGMPLISAIDVEIKTVFNEMTSKSIVKSRYHNN